MRLAWSAVDLPYRHGRFTISAEDSTTARTLLLEADDGGQRGYGEAVPSVRVTGADAAALHLRLEDAARHLDKMAVKASEVPPPLPWGPVLGPAACAVDGALLDLWARHHGRPLWRCLGLLRAEVATSATVSLGTAPAMAAQARAHAEEGFRILKVKLGTDPQSDLARIQAIRAAAPRAVLRVDGNEGWRLDEVVQLAPAFAEAGVELIEQPLSRDASDDDSRRLTRLVADLGMVHVLDERVHGVADVALIGRERLADGVNLKLQKAGGLRAGLAVIEAAEAHDLEVMVGCFVETWAGISLALQLAGTVRWVDLDGAWLLADEPLVPQGRPFLEDGVLRASEAPGLGLTPAPRFQKVFEGPTTSL